MSAPTPAELLAIARRAAAAGAAVLAERKVGGHIGASTKTAGGDWVTDFDRRAEQAVRDVLRAARPNDEITGEEYGTTVPQDPSGYSWSIDPLDGTTNFVRGIVYYATSVAVAGPAPEGRGATSDSAQAPADWAAGSLKQAPAPGGAGSPGLLPEGSVWLAGVVQAPALGRTYWASRGEGAWLSEGEGASDLRLAGPDPDTDGPLIATGFGYDAERRRLQVGALEGLMPGFANVRRLGSAALDLCLVADGTLDAYAEFGTQVHDWSAAALIAEEAGVPVLRPVSEPGWSAAGRIDFDALPGLGS